MSEIIREPTGAPGIFKRRTAAGGYVYEARISVGPKRVRRTLEADSLEAAVSERVEIRAALRRQWHRTHPPKAGHNRRLGGRLTGERPMNCRVAVDVTALISMLLPLVREGDPDLYVVEDGHGNMKIGYSVNPTRRIRDDLQPANATELRVVAVIPGAAALEQPLHSLLAGDRVRGEWFQAHEDSKRFVSVLFLAISHGVGTIPPIGGNPAEGTDLRQDQHSPLRLVAE